MQNEITQREMEMEVQLGHVGNVPRLLIRLVMEMEQPKGHVPILLLFVLLLVPVNAEKQLMLQVMVMEQHKDHAHLLHRYAPLPENVNAENQQVPQVMVMEQHRDHVALANSVKQMGNVHRN